MLLLSTINQHKFSTTPGNLNYFYFISERILHHYSHHCNEYPPMLSVSEFIESLNKNQLSIKITVQRDDFTDHDYPFGCHIHFDNDSIRITNCKVSSKNYLFLTEAKTETGQEVKLFWGEQHFELLKNTEPCTETITEFEKLKQQIKTKRCVDLNKLHSISNSLQKRSQ